MRLASKHEPRALRPARLPSHLPRKTTRQCNDTRDRNGASALPSQAWNRPSVVSLVLFKVAREGASVARSGDRTGCVQTSAETAAVGKVVGGAVEGQRVRDEPGPPPLRPVRCCEVAMGVRGRAPLVQKQRTLRQPMRRASSSEAAGTIVGGGAVEWCATKGLIRSCSVSGGGGSDGHCDCDCACLLSCLAGASETGGLGVGVSALSIFGCG
jgi:hypothetical protein